MKTSNVLEAGVISQRFQRAVKELMLRVDKETQDKTIGYPWKEAAAVKRVSMDLTRSLSKMRQET